MRTGWIAWSRSVFSAVSGPGSAGGVDEDPARELGSARGGEEGSDLRVRNGLARLQELALDGGEAGFVTEPRDEVDTSVSLIEVSLAGPVGEGLTS